MVANNLGYLAHLVAQIHGCSKIYFGGKFVRRHPFTMANVTRGVQFSHKHFSSSNSMAPGVLFIKHDGYLGAIGGLLLNSDVVLLSQIS